MAPARTDDNLASIESSSTGPNMSKVLNELQELDNHVQRVLETIQSPEMVSWLGKQLHDPDQLPDQRLEDMALKLVDRMDQIQLQLVPSVSLLTDGFFGYLNSKVLWTVVDAHVADHLAKSGPQQVSTLGLRCGIQPERLSQLLDTLVNNGIFAYDAKQHTYRNNRVSELLRHDHWSQWHLWTDLYPNEFFNVSRAMPDAVKLGESRTAAQIEYGTDLDLFEYLSQQGKLAQFQKTLGAGAVAQAKGLGSDYPWEEIGSENPILDIGGGSGSFLATILRAHPNLVGGIMDLQSVIDLVTPEFREATGKFADIGPRVQQLLVGDFLKHIPASTVYTMKWCLHDWVDDDVVTILKNVRRSIIASPVSRFIVFESIKAPGRSGRLPRYGDLVMMITCNGKERSMEDWERLGQLSGWRVEKVHRIRRAWPCAIDFRPV
uniref:O-methyltransferase n=1 Tax=Penicillium lilacinoechinulatum TaxID=451136 RepID=A9Q1F3_9EURO|nr:O-methyltransferase [Penicillium lilacinoechinulatum]